ncbi:MAG: hypothetical protein SGJ09_02495 [Phycisphaerae bacterium]|nr:hypothetical protein [Phycisphaerae bacterium]
MIPTIQLFANQLLASLLLVSPVVAVDDPKPAPAADPAAIAPEDDHALRRFFAPLTSTLSDALERFDRTDALPDSSWNPFEETKKKNAARINALLDECAGLLAEGEATNVRQQIRVLEAERSALESTIRDGFEKHTAAKLKSEREWYELVGKTKEEWDESIKVARTRQAEIDSEIAALRAAFGSQMRRLGLELGDDGANALLATVSGDRFVDMAQAFDNVRLVTEQLRRITERMKESPDTAKRYYGMYVLLVRVMDRVQDDFVAQIETSAIPTIDRYGKDAGDTARQAQTLLKTADAQSRLVLEKNIAACQLASEATTNYRTYLLAQAARVKELNRIVEDRLRVAENTYRTMTVSVGVAELIRQGEVDLRAVTSMDLPALRGFDNVALREQYERLNERLRAQ